MVLVRPRAWWYSKVPLSVTLLLLLLDGHRLSGDAVAMLLSVVLTVSAMANYGYAINDLFDMQEDARIARVNAATTHGRRHVAAIAVGSGLAVTVLGTVAAGAVGAALSLVILCLPLAYSVPPIRLKERTWLGAVADGLAAHVYPAVLALLAWGEWIQSPLASGLIACVIIWSAAAGLRGILTHQIHSVDADRRAGLVTLASGRGVAPLEALTLGVILPIELIAFGGALVLADTGPVLWAILAVYIAYEAFKTLNGGFTVTVLRPEGQRYVPFIEESFYKAWGPLALAADAARIDLLYLLLVPAYALAFRLHMLIEWRRLALVAGALRSMGPAARSSGGS